MYNVEPELKHNKEQMLRQYSSSPNNAKPNVGGSGLLSNIKNIVNDFVNNCFNSVNIVCK